MGPLGSDPAALVVGTALVVGGMGALVGYAIGRLHGDRDATRRIEGWHRRRP